MDQTLLQSLKELKHNKYMINSEDVEPLLEKILPHIGDEDPEIRDHLLYGVMAHLFHDNHLSEEKLTSYVYQLISDNYLFYDLENHYPYSVLRRSFTLLQLVILVYVHRRDNAMNHEAIESLYEAFINYFKNEKILTGYKEPVGWIHAIAHSADLFAQLMQVSWFDRKTILDMFYIIAKKITIDYHLYIANEEERMVAAIKKGLEQKKLSNHEILTWLETFLIDEVSTDYLKKMTLIQNIKHFLSSLYFSCINDSSYVFITQRISEIIELNDHK